MILAADNPLIAQAAQQGLRSAAGHVMPSNGRDVLVVEAAAEIIKSLESEDGVAGVFTGAAPEDLAARLDETGRLGIAARNAPLRILPGGDAETDGRSLGVGCSLRRLPPNILCYT